MPSSYTMGGTIQWMSPEILALDQSSLKTNRPTKESDCYALGMVIYEVLSGHIPFPQCTSHNVMWKVMSGERPERPEEAEEEWFTDDIWQMLNRCWETQPESRPNVADVLECLEQVSRDPEPPFLQADGDDSNLPSDSSRRFSWSNPRNFAASLRRILC